MRRDPIVLFDNGTHKCVSFDNLVTGGGVQSNQFVIVNGDQAILLDPGGDLTYTTLTLEIAKHLALKDLTYVFASHQDPDIVASLDKWLLHTNARVVCSKLWARFLPHLVANYLSNNHGINTYERIIQLPDAGGVIPLGNSKLLAIPAHFLHSEGNFQIYDPISKILFSGDLGASIVDDGSAVKDFDEHVANMIGFHQRYMISNKVSRFWANMVRGLDMSMMVPQHGRHFEGKEMINKFIDWFENLECGVDLLTQQNYVLPKVV